MPALYFVAAAGGMERALEGGWPGRRPLPAARQGRDRRRPVAAAATARSLCEAAGALFLLNDRPDLAAASGADGVHVGEDDMRVDRARKLVGHDATLVKLSTHSMQQAQAGCRTGADYIAVGPVHATPTKEGRPAIGVEPIEYAAAHVSVPWFAIGGLDAGNVGAVVKAGARRIVVVRAIAQADDPEAAARALRAATNGGCRGGAAASAAPRPGRRSRRRRRASLGTVAAAPPRELGHRSRQRRRASPTRPIACAAATRAPRSATPRSAPSSSRSAPASGRGRS